MRMFCCKACQLQAIHGVNFLQKDAPNSIIEGDWQNCYQCLKAPLLNKISFRNKPLHRIILAIRCALLQIRIYNVQIPDSEVSQFWQKVGMERDYQKYTLSAHYTMDDNPSRSSFYHQYQVTKSLNESDQFFLEFYW